MELPFEKRVSRFWQQKLYAPVTKEETQEYKLPESMPDIGRVISAWGQVVIRGKEWRNSHIGVSGGVMVWVLYEAEDGSGVKRVESWLPVSVRVEHSHTGDDGVIRVESVLCGVDARSISSRKLMLRCTVGLMVQTLTRREAELAEPGELPGDIEVLERSYPVVLTRETGEKTFLVDERVSVPGGRVDRIVYHRLLPRVTEQKVLGSRGVFRGVGELHLLCQDESGQLFSADVEVPFAQYLDLEGDYDEGAEISNLLCVTSLEAEPEEDGQVWVRCGMVSQYIVNAPAVIRCLEDAYSPLRELELVRSPLELPAWLDEQVRQIELQDRAAGEEVSVDQIFFPDLPTVTRLPGTAEVRVGGSFQCLGRAADGTLQGRTEKAGETISIATECDTVPCTWLRGGVGRGGGARMELRLSSVSTKPLDILSGIRAGEMREPDPDRPGVIIRARRAEESLWDIAKYCGSTVSAIQRLNKLEGEPEANRLLLIPVV